MGNAYPTTYCMVAVSGELSSVKAVPARWCQEEDATPNPRAGMPTIESMLKDLELPFVQTKSGEYKVVYTDSSGDTSTIYLKYSSVGDLPEDQIIFLYTQVMEPPEAVPDPVRFYKEMAKYNDDLVVGRISVSDNGYVFYSSSCWLRKVDSTTLGESSKIARCPLESPYVVVLAVVNHNI